LKMLNGNWGARLVRHWYEKARREILFRVADLLHCRKDELLYYQSQDYPATTKSPPDPGFHHQVFIRVVAWNQAIRSDFTS
jgi:hypothetical protein